MAEIWGAVAAAVVGVAGSAVVANNSRPSTPAARNLGNEVGGIQGQLQTPGQAGNNLSQIINGTPNWTAFGNTQQGRDLIAGSNDWYGDNPAFADPASRFQDMLNNGYLDPSKLPSTGGIGQLSSQLDTQNRTNNLNDVQNLAGQYNNVIRSANPEYYAALASYNTAANAPVVPGEAQVAAQANALRGYNTPLSGALNSQALGMARPLQSWGAKPGGFQAGGFTGVGGRNQPAGIVHRGEYVIPAPAVNRIGVQKLNRLAGLPGYASGGLVATSEGDPTNGGTNQGPDGMGDFTFYSGGGQPFGGLAGYGTSSLPTGNGSPDALGKGGAMGGVSPLAYDAGKLGGSNGNIQTLTSGGYQASSPSLGTTSAKGDNTTNTITPVVPTPTQGPTSDQGPQIAVEGPGFLPQTPGTTGTTSTPGAQPTTTNPAVSSDYWGGSALGFSDLQNQQNRIGMGLLQQGGDLSASDLRNVQQASRGGFAARGLDATNASVVDETFNTDAARRARLLQNLSTAQGIQNQGLAETTNQQNFGLNLNAQGLQAQGLQNQALGQSAALAEQQREFQLQQQANAANLYGASRVDPYAAIIGGTNTSLLGSAMGLYGQINPSANALYGYGSDLNNTNYNAQAAANISGANNQAALYGAGINAAGRVGQAYFNNQGSTTNPGTGHPSYAGGGAIDYYGNLPD